METLDALILGALQGVTEFVPISSSGHLVIAEEFLGLDVSSLKSFDVIVHVGTLLAILLYFWDDVWGLISAFWRLVSGRLEKDDPYGRMILYIVIGTVPAVFAGVYLGEWIDGIFRNVSAVGWAMMGVGFVFLLAEFVYKFKPAEGFFTKVRDFFRRDNAEKEVREMRWWKAILIGLAQATALIPGVSRSGMTISAGLFSGVERTNAARFSFLLGVPAILGAGIYTGIGEMGNGAAEGAICLNPLPLIVGFLASFVVGFLSISLLMKFLKKHSLVLFAIYLIGMGLIIQNFL
jgi:undecaprenyl-diphosphatase